MECHSCPGTHKTHSGHSIHRSLCLNWKLPHRGTWVLYLDFIVVDAIRWQTLHYGHVTAKTERKQTLKIWCCNSEAIHTMDIPVHYQGDCMELLQAPWCHTHSAKKLCQGMSELAPVIDLPSIFGSWMEGMPQSAVVQSYHTSTHTHTHTLGPIISRQTSVWGE